VFAASALALPLLAAPAVAIGILGTDRSETIRGTPSADRIFARRGNDTVLGLAGADVLAGGAGRDRVDGGRGADLLALVDGERDSASCGPGRDTVVADIEDAVRTDCETVTRAPALPPPSPPPRTVVPGRYGGKTTQGQDVAFQVSSGGTLSKVRFSAVLLTCQPAGPESLAWPYDSGTREFTVATDGTFTVSEDGTRSIAGSPATYRVVVAGRFQSGFASGTVAVEARWEDGGGAHACGVSPAVEWTAAAGVLNEP
jgi:hypothetical protein